MSDDRIREQLEALGREPAPPDVVDRLERVLAAEPPTVANRRRRRTRRVLSIAAPVAVAAGISLAVIIGVRGGESGGRPPSPTVSSPVAVEAAPTAPPAGSESASAGVAPPGTASPQFDTGQASNAARDAAIGSYRAVERAVRRRRHGIR